MRGGYQLSRFSPAPPPLPAQQILFAIDPLHNNSMDAPSPGGAGSTLLPDETVSYPHPPASIYELFRFQGHKNIPELVIWKCVLVQFLNIVACQFLTLHNPFTLAQPGRPRPESIFWMFNPNRALI